MSAWRSKKLSHETGAISTLVKASADDAKLIEELYLRVFSRFPTTKETEALAAHLAKKPNERQKAAEDLAWALLNSLEFQFNH